MFEPWPDEPDEPDTERRWGNPERDLPRIPEVSTEESDVDPHTFKTFWVSVVFANVALFGVSLGAMLWYFRGQALLGAVLLLTGVLAGLRTYVSYRRFKTGDAEESHGAAEDADPVDSETDAQDSTAADAQGTIADSHVTENADAAPLGPAATDTDHQATAESDVIVDADAGSDADPVERNG